MLIMMKNYHHNRNFVWLTALSLFSQVSLCFSKASNNSSSSGEISMADAPPGTEKKPDTSNGPPDLSVLGEPNWNRLRAGWSLTVNDQCIYEFVFQFEHDLTFPKGPNEFGGKCAFKDPKTKKPYLADDGISMLEPRQFWDMFPEYVWATMGFNHLSVDWYPCGHQPKGYTAPHYDFSFYRVPPEFRAWSMTCDLLVDEKVVIPGEKVCAFTQESIQGMGFFIVPGALVNRNPVVNMPESFTRPILGFGPYPYVGLRSWDQELVPPVPELWKDTSLFMSSYSGDIVVWQPHIPYSMISGEQDIFTSNTAQYHETTIQTLPDTWAFDWDVEDGVIRFHMVGKAHLCRADFEAAQKAAGGPPVFPNYNDLLGTDQHVAGTGGSGSGDGTNGNGKGKSGVASNRTVNQSLLAAMFGFLLWCLL